MAAQAVLQPDERCRCAEYRPLHRSAKQHNGIDGKMRGTTKQRAASYGLKSGNATHRVSHDKNLWRSRTLLRAVYIAEPLYRRLYERSLI